MRPAFVETLAAWCVVPYDDRERSPEDRAHTLRDLGFDGLAWDWREEHVPQFEAQLEALLANGLDLTAIWAPVPDGVVTPALEAQVRTASDRGLAPQLWACAEFGAPGPVTHDADPAEYADRLEPLARLAAENGLRIALYNHLGWYGEPLNQLRVLEELARRGYPEHGIVYVQHHGHAHMDGFTELWPRFQHKVIALGLNGMRDGAHWGDGKVLPYGHGPRDLELARVIAGSGWRGPVALIGHTMDPIEYRLEDDLAGLNWISRALDAHVTHPTWPH